MAQSLFIRVMAQTYDEKDVPSNWPFVFASVWPEKDTDGVDSARKLARLLTPTPQRGVLELVDGFYDYAHYNEMPEERRKLIIPAADRAAALKRDLEDALGNRDVTKASALCLSIEDSLDKAEELLSGLGKHR